MQALYCKPRKEQSQDSLIREKNSKKRTLCKEIEHLKRALLSCYSTMRTIKTDLEETRAELKNKVAELEKQDRQYLRQKKKWENERALYKKEILALEKALLDQSKKARAKQRLHDGGCKAIIGKIKSLEMTIEQKNVEKRHGIRNLEQKNSPKYKLIQAIREAQTGFICSSPPHSHKSYNTVEDVPSDEVSENDMSLESGSAFDERLSESEMMDMLVAIPSPCSTALHFGKDQYSRRIYDRIRFEDKHQLLDFKKNLTLPSL